MQGAYAGFLVSLLLTLWLGVGANVYKPYVPKPPVSIEGCPVDDVVSNMTTVLTTVVFNATTETPLGDGPRSDM